MLSIGNCRFYLYFGIVYFQLKSLCMGHFFSSRSIEIRNGREIAQNKTLEHLAERLDWHGKTSISMFNKHKYLRTLDLETVKCIEIRNL